MAEEGKSLCIVCSTPDCAWQCVHCTMRLCGTHISDFELSHADMLLYNTAQDTDQILDDMTTNGVRTICKQCVLPYLLHFVTTQNAGNLPA